MKNFNITLIILFIIVFLFNTEGNAQNETIIYGDSLYMDRVIIREPQSYEDSCSYILKSNLPQANYLVVSQNRLDTFMIVTQEISYYYSDRGTLELEVLKHLGKFYARIDYEINIYNDKVSRRIILANPKSECSELAYYFDFDENWNLLNCFIEDESEATTIINAISMDSFGVIANGNRSGAWVFFQDGRGRHVDLYDQGVVIYSIEL